jgi:hypothetical protein
MLPNDAIVGLIATEASNLFGIGEQIGEQCAEFEAEVLVEQQLHAAVMIRRSRSAAYAKQARMSSSVSSA